ncbi:MAG TPA: tyrosine--tRNA ligase [Candidatus Paceibacterota bacterium]
MTAKVSTDEKKIDDLLSRSTSEVIVKEELRKKLLSGERLRIKLGVDPTSPHLHLGRAVALLKMRDFEELGHQVVFIVGDFTAVIGDTSDKDAERPMLTHEEVARNEASYKEQAGKLIDMTHAEFHHNSEWLGELKYGEIGRQADAFSVADFIARDNIARRLSAGKRVSLREVLYPLMQGYDSVKVRADVEIGGMDQKFNLLAGRSLQDFYGQAPQNIIMGPLLEGTDGRKMSSSWGNTITFSMAPADMYGKVMSVHDEFIVRYFELCTRVPMEEVRQIGVGLADQSLHPKEAKMRLAHEITALYHGTEAARAAEGSWTATFSEGGVPADAPTIEIEAGTKLRDALKDIAGSTSELRRLVDAGAVSEVGGKTFASIDDVIASPATLRIGKHRFAKVVIK